MKIVVTGALGHIGSALIRDIPNWAKNPEIVMVDNMSAKRYCSLFELPTNASYRLLDANVHSMELAPVVAGADLVVHLAAITDAAGSFEIREKLEHENFYATKLVADACLESKVKMVALSSTSVYGTANDVVDEDCSEDELKPQSPYAMTKLKEEAYVQKLAREDGLQAVVYRFGTIFGVSPGMRFHTAVNKFCYQASVGQPITVWRTALDQKRPYLDLVDGVRALRHTFEKQIFDGEIYNVLTLNTSVRTIVESIEKKVGKVQVELVDAQIMNQLSYEVSNSKYEKTGFKVSGNLERGINETLDRLGGLWRSRL